MDKVKELENYLIDLYENDEKIIGIFISGSCADNSYDSYSDVDIRFIVNTTDLENNVLEFKNKLITSSKEILFFEPCCFSNAFIAHFYNFIKADIFFYTQDMISPSAWLKDIRVVKDFDNFIFKIKEQSKQLEFGNDYTNVENDISKYFATAHECFRRIKREEYLYANVLLQTMKEIIIKFYDCLNNRASLSWYKVEIRFDNSQISIFKLTIAKDSKNIEILKQVNSQFLFVEQKLCESKNISRDFNKDSYVLSYFLSL